MLTTSASAGQIETKRAFGRGLARCLGLDEARTHVQQAPRRNPIEVSPVRLGLEPADSVRTDDSFLITVHLENLAGHDGRPTTTEELRAGAVYLYELDRDPRVRVFRSAEMLHFFLPREALDGTAEQHGLPAISDVKCKPAMGFDDPVMLHLGRAVIELLQRPQLASGILLDEILNAVCGHIVTRYGGSRRTGLAGGLSPSQERRAKELIDSNLQASLADIAESCGLSVTHLARGFKQTTGMSPHQWLIERRVNKAKELLSQTDMPIAEIALECAFASQSHLNATFAAKVGMPPGRWRRSR